MLEQRRRQALALLEQGMKGVQVAQAVGTSPASVSRWREAYRKGGAAALAGNPHPGKPPGLTARQREKLARLLLGGARKQGCNTELWTLKRMAEVIQGTLASSTTHAASGMCCGPCDGATQSPSDLPASETSRPSRLGGRSTGRG